MDEAKNSFKKIQVVYKHSLPEKLEDLSNIVILNKTGRVTTLLIKGNVDETMERFKMENPILLEELPMTLEDVFVTTLGGEHNVS
ncbi:ABC transporter ATP-binding protein, partial [Fictibacillus sp. Mic-4]